MIANILSLIPRYKSQNIVSISRCHQAEFLYTDGLVTYLLGEIDIAVGYLNVCQDLAGNLGLVPRYNAQYVVHIFKCHPPEFLS